MEKKYLDELKNKISKLSINEKKLRDLYLRDIALGKIEGPMTGYASIDKPWLKYYPEEAVTTDIPNKKIYDLIWDKRKDTPNLIAFSYIGKKIKYKKFFKEVEKAAKGLKKLGVKKGDIVSLALPTMPESFYLLYAINRVGAVADFIDPRLTKEGFEDNLKTSNSRVLFALDMTQKEVDNIDPNLIDKVVYLRPSESFPFLIKVLYNLKNKFKTSNKKSINWKSFLKNGKQYKGVIDTEFGKDEPALVVHTGGTTGKSKGVILTNENMNTMAVTQEISGFNQAEKDKLLNFLPPFIAFCLVNAVHDPLYLGFETVLVPQFDVKDFPKLMHQFHPEHVLSGPILWDLYIKSPLVEKDDISNLKSAISGGDVLNVELEKEVNSYFAEHGCKTPLNQGYGMTELSAAACYGKTESYALGSVGIPYAKNNIKIVNEEGEEVQIGEQGEIHISSPTIMKEYLNNQSATDEIIYEENSGRWIKTGDIGYMNENGNLYVIGRIKRMIVRSGNKIFPSTIENIIKQNPAVSSVAVVALPDTNERHVPVAHIVFNEEIDKPIEEIINEINKSIAIELPDFNIPVMYILKKDLPLTKINKIDFKKLEAEEIDFNSGNVYYSADILNQKRKSFTTK